LAEAGGKNADGLGTALEAVIPTITEMVQA
jgi:hypothetical protein